MYDIGKIYHIATRFRHGIEVTKEYGYFEGDGWFENFPRGCCDPASELLGRYLLEEHGMRSFDSGGRYGKDDSHAWLTLDDGIIVDITGDQYKDRPGRIRYTIPVYVGMPDEFHQLFRLHKPIEITQNMWHMETFEMSCLKMQKDDYYKKIVYFMDE